MNETEKQHVIESTKLLFEMGYMPVAMSRERFNGSDFIVIAVDIMDGIRKQNNDTDVIKQSAITLVKCFNEQLSPKMPVEDCIEMVKLLISNSELLRFTVDNLVKSGDGYLK
jgi:hypothetical protein